MKDYSKMTPEDWLELQFSKLMVSQENNIEWINGQKVVSVFFSQKKYIKKIKDLAEECPDDVVIEATNKDGSIVASIPLSFVQIRKPPTVSLTDAQKAERVQRLRSAKNVEVDR